MARLPRICLPRISQHVIQRGNNRQACFGSEEDFAAYAHWLEEYARKFRVAIHAWVFMTNHVHLLLPPETGEGVSRLMQTLGGVTSIIFTPTNEAVPYGKGGGLSPVGLTDPLVPPGSLGPLLGSGSRIKTIWPN